LKIKKHFFIILVSVFAIQGYSQIQIGNEINGDSIGDNLGNSVALSNDGNIMAVGAYWNSYKAVRAGRVKIYKNISGIWTQLGSDIDGDSAVDYCGFSVSLSGDGSIVAISSSANNKTGPDAGLVRLYKYNSGTWVQLGPDIYGEAAYDYFGYSVSLSDDGSVVAIGAPFNDGRDPSAGHVRVFKYNAGTWNQLGVDIDGESKDDNSGWSVSISKEGNIVAIGAKNASGKVPETGHVRIFQFSNGSWSQLGGDIDGISAFDLFGWSVSLSADGLVVAIGSYLYNVGGTSSGQIQVYKYNLGTWTQLGNNINGEFPGDYCGYAVSLSDDGNILVDGAPLSKNTASAGHVRIFKYLNGKWNKVGNNIVGEAVFDQCGFFVANSADGSVVAVGAPYNKGNGAFAGHVRVFGFGDLLSTQRNQIELDISVCPNPSSSQIEISVKPDLINKAYVVTDMMGKILKSGRLFAENTVVDLGNFPSGSYVLRLIGELTSPVKLIKI
jgi:hypothetical protein